jgi:hypothetical protein
VLTEPLRRFAFRDDRKDFDGFACDVIEHPHLSDPETILELAHSELYSYLETNLPSLE